MISICWNCRGIRAASTVKELKELIYNFKPHLVFLSETKAKKNRMQNIKRRLNFDDMFVVDCIGRSGGLCLFWKSSVNVDILYSNNNVIHTFVTFINANKSFH